MSAFRKGSKSKRGRIARPLLRQGNDLCRKTPRLKGDSGAKPDLPRRLELRSSSIGRRELGNWLAEIRIRHADADLRKRIVEQHRLTIEDVEHIGKERR